MVFSALKKLDRTICTILLYYWNLKKAELVTLFTIKAKGKVIDS